MSPAFRALTGDARRNQICVLLRQRGPMSRAELSRATGIAKSSMSLLVNQLVDLELVTVREATPANRSKKVRGRPGELVELNASSGAAIGVEFGYSHVRTVIGDVSHEILAEREVELSLNYDARQGVAAAAELVTELLHATRITPSRILGLGVAVQAAVNENRFARTPPRMNDGWRDCDIAVELAEASGFKVAVENDANLAAYAEMLWGIRLENFIYLKIQSGVGGALVFDNRIMTGQTGNAGEIGHLVLNEDGPICQCGQRGCLETYSSIPALLSVASMSRGHKVDLVDFAKALADEDVVCTRIVKDAADRIGQAIALITQVIDPGAVVLQGTVLDLHPQMFTWIADRVNPSRGQRLIMQGELGSRASALGAVAMVLAQG